MDTSCSFYRNIEKAESVVGPLQDWERRELEANPDDFGRACFNLAEDHTTLTRTIEWLQLGSEEGHECAILAHAALLHGLNPEVEYKGDEAAWWVKRVKDEGLVEKVGSFDADGSRARRYLTRVLLSGSLSKYQDSVLYRSFFHSGLREVHLLPLISKYLVEEEREPNDKKEMKSEPRLDIYYLHDICQVIFGGYTSTTHLTLFMKPNNQFLCFLPLLFSLLVNLKYLILKAHQMTEQHIDLSYLHHANTSKLENLLIVCCSYHSLSPLSLCDLSSFKSLEVRKFPQVDGLHPLNGLSSDITRSLKHLVVTNCHLKDLSPLSDCDLSLIESLCFEDNSSLSDLSPLRGSDLSSLIRFGIGSTNISDLSPLCDCKGLALKKLNLYQTPIEDLSPLSLLDLSRLEVSIQLRRSNISDLSPLENISYENISAHIDFSPAWKRLKKEGIKSPHLVGKVMLTWVW